MKVRVKSDTSMFCEYSGDPLAPPSTYVGRIGYTLDIAPVKGYDVVVSFSDNTDHGPSFLWSELEVLDITDNQ